MTSRQYNKKPLLNCIEANKVFIKILVQDYLATKPNLSIDRFPDDRGANQNLNIDQKEMGQVLLDPRLKSIICGTILGDASIAKQKGYANARIQYRHSTRQMEWFLWKTLGPFKNYKTDNSIQFQAPDGFQEGAARLPGELLGKVRISTLVDENFTQIQKIVAPKNKKRVKRSWLNHMNSLFLSTLWCDDGSLTNRRQGVISVNSLTMEDAETLADYITVVWGVKCKAIDCESKRTKTNPVAPQIEISDLDNLEKFLRIVAPLIPVKSMLYKVCLCPLDEGRLQRWASEVENLVLPEFKDEVQKIYAYYTIVLSVGSAHT